MPTGPDQPTPVETATNIGNLALGVASIFAPAEVALYAAFRAVLREAPLLYPSFVALFTNAPMSDAAKAQWAAATTALMNPESVVEQSKKDLQAAGTIP